MRSKQFFTKILFLTIIAFINYSCYANRLVSNEEITSKDFKEDVKITFNDGTSTIVHSKNIVIQDSLIKFTGINLKSIPLKEVNKFEVNEFQLFPTIFLIAAGVAFIVIAYTLFVVESFNNIKY